MVEIETRSGVLITVPESEMPVSVSGAMADSFDVVDALECAKIIKAHCEAAEDCRTCAFGRSSWAICTLHDIPDKWEV